MKKTKKEIKREQKNRRRLNELSRQNSKVSTMRFNESSIKRNQLNDLLIYCVEGRNDKELNNFLEPWGLNVKDLIWLGNTINPVGKVFYNPLTKFKKLSENDIYQLRVKLNPKFS